MKTFVINLDKYLDKFLKQKPFLEKIGLNVNRFSGINAINNEHLKHKSLINNISQIITPNSIIGCGLSHILLAEHIKNLNLDISLIMEDDAFPLFQKKKFHKLLKKTIQEISIIDKEWDIIQLHSDAPFPTHDTYFTHTFCGSTAAYLISKKGAIKMSNQQLITHMDIQTSINPLFKKYRSHHNLFWTDEKNSLNRISSNNFLTYLKVSILNLIPLRGEKTWEDFLNFKLIKLPYFNKDLTADQITSYLIIFIILQLFFTEINKRFSKLTLK